MGNVWLYFAPGEAATLRVAYINRTLEPIFWVGKKWNLVVGPSNKL